MLDKQENVERFGISGTDFKSPICLIVNAVPGDKPICKDIFDDDFDFEKGVECPDF